jgi:hypothetical protein
VLEVIEDQQQPTIAQVIAQGVDRTLRALDLDARLSAIRAATSSADSIAIRLTKWTSTGLCAALRRATSMTSRVFPTPPAPHTTIRRLRAATSASSSREQVAAVAAQIGGQSVHVDVADRGSVDVNSTGRRLPVQRGVLRSDHHTVRDESALGADWVECKRLRPGRLGITLSRTARPATELDADLTRLRAERP